MLLGLELVKDKGFQTGQLKYCAQVEYAAIDAWICLKILQAFKDNSLFP